MLSSQPPGTTLIYGHEGTSHNTVTSTPRLNNSVSKCPDSVMFLVVVLRRGRMRHSFEPCACGSRWTARLNVMLPLGPRSSHRNSLGRCLPVTGGGGPLDDDIHNRLPVLRGER